MGSTLHTPPVDRVLAELARRAQSEDPPAIARMRVHEEQLGRRVYGRERGAVYGLAPLSITPEVGELLYVLAMAARVRTIVEFGASLGFSTIHLAAAARDLGGARVITTEMEPEKARLARQNLADAGLDDLVDLREGDALITLADVDEVDLLFLDGWNNLYLPVLDLLGAGAVCRRAGRCGPERGRSGTGPLLPADGRSGLRLRLGRRAPGRRRGGVGADLVRSVDAQALVPERQLIAGTEPAAADVLPVQARPVGRVEVLNDPAAVAEREPGVRRDTVSSATTTSQLGWRPITSSSCPPAQSSASRMPGSPAPAPARGRCRSAVSVWSALRRPGLPEARRVRSPTSRAGSISTAAKSSSSRWASVRSLSSPSA